MKKYLKIENKVEMKTDRFTIADVYSLINIFVVAFTISMIELFFGSIGLRTLVVWLCVFIC